MQFTFTWQIKFQTLEFSAKREHFSHHSCVRFDPLFRGTMCTYTHKLKTQKQPSKHFLFSKTSSRRLEDVFSVTLFVLEDVFKTSSRRVCKTSWKTKKCYTEDVFSTSSPRRMFVGKAFLFSTQTRYISDLHLLK